MKKFYIAYDTDVGIKKKTNQDSLLLKGCSEEHGETLLIAICDGMGGMEKGEEGIRQQWQSLLEEINGRLIRYGKENQIQLGTTISAVLLNSDGQYMLCHVGDTRIYTLSDTLQQLTEDHTFIAREIKRGNMTIEEDKKDNRRNVLLQCIGVNEFFEPQYENGRLAHGTALLLCSDGFRHMLSEDEISESLNPHKNLDEAQIKEKLREMIEWNKQRMETDNISAIYIKLK